MVSLKRTALSALGTTLTALAAKGAMVSLKRTALGLWVPLVLLASWEVSTSAGVLDPLFFPAPSTLLAAAWRMLESGELARQLRVTLTRLALGWVGGSACGLLLGVLLGAVAQIRQALEPSISALYSTPKLVLLPMLMLFLGVGDAPRILLIAVGCFILMVMHGMDAVRGVNRGYLELAANYGADRMMMFRKVYLPSSLPQIFTGLRVALGRALVLTVSIEILSAPDGLGNMIWMAWQTLATEKLYIGVILSAALGAFFHALLRRLENQWVPWRQA